MNEIKNVRLKTGLTQKTFAKKYGIPLSTLQKWEQGETRPSQYIVNLISNDLSAGNGPLRKIKGDGKGIFYYDQLSNTVGDGSGIRLKLPCSIQGVKENNLYLYLEDMFAGYRHVMAKFSNDCHYDHLHDVEWKKMG